ncbi:Alpha/Beta hydrolase protein [Phaeosphaeria sp. MPI-PUGE-AT-0046c]|nr:Alpha/Beta hydrolase protein [Phaeosphaeria sp. MPI-PUGE-AT-0046c]
MSSETWKQMLDASYVNPELAELLRTGGPVVSLDASTDIQALRHTLLEKKRAMTAAAAPSTSDVEETDHDIPTRDGASIVVRTYRPRRGKPGPVLVILHGGGWVLGGLDNEALLCRTWAEKFYGVAVNVDYRLAPEFKFPIAVFDCYDAVRWVAANPHVYGGDLSKGFIVGGVSAGANMATTVTHLARDDTMFPSITGCWLSIPSLLAPTVVPERYKKDYLSREQNKDAPILNSGALALFRKLYEDDPASPLMSPVLFPSHKDLPPAYFQIAGMDPLRDEGLIYERILREEMGIRTRMDLYPGLPHGFSSWWPRAAFSKKQREDGVEGLHWLLCSRPE